MPPSMVCIGTIRTVPPGRANLSPCLLECSAPGQSLLALSNRRKRSSTRTGCHGSVRLEAMSTLVVCSSRTDASHRTIRSVQGTGRAFK